MTEEFSFKCGGACCKKFALPVSPRDIFMSWLGLIHVESRSALGLAPHNIGVNIRDIKTLNDMLVPLGFKHEDPATGEAMAGRWVYSCNRHDSETGLCKRYEERPWMCRVYDPGKCMYRNCGKGGGGEENG